MNDLFNNPGFVALAAALFGGGGLEFIRRLLDRKQRKNDESAKLRAELRTDLDGLKARLSAGAAEEVRLEAELERWRGLFYDQKEEHIKLIGELQVLTAQLAHYQNQFNPTHIAVTKETAQTASDERDAQADTN